LRLTNDFLSLHVDLPDARENDMQAFSDRKKIRKDTQNGKNVVDNKAGRCGAETHW